jgi:drug/metabolite transporter (DMT)-like permease
VGVASAALVLAIWTSFLLVARGSATRTLTAWDIAWVRFVFSGLVVLPWVLWRWRALRAGLGGAAALARGAALTATAGVGYCSLAYSGFFYAPAAHAAVLLPGSLPLWTAVFAVGLLGERLTRPRLLGLGLIVCGDLLVGGSSLLAAASGGGAGTWRGDLLFLAASGSWALYGVLCRRWRVGAIDATLVVALGCLVSAVPLYALAVAAGAVPSRLAWAPWGEIAFHALFQGGLAMLVAGVAFTQVVATFGPVRATMITAVVPVLAALAAVPLLGEPLGVPALGGLACVTVGLLLGAGLWPRPGRPQVALP